MEKKTMNDKWPESSAYFGNFQASKFQLLTKNQPSKLSDYIKIENRLINE